MNTTRLRQAKRLFFHPDVPRNLARHNAKQWARMVRLLGRNWLAHPQRLERLPQQ